MKTRRRYAAPRLETVTEEDFSVASEALRALQAAAAVSPLTTFSIDSVLSLMQGAPMPAPRPSAPLAEAQ